METRGIRMAVGGALTATLVLAVGLGTASAQRSDPCGATTPRSTCEKGGVLFGGIYQVHYELTSGASPTVTCAGGPSLDSRDSASLRELHRLPRARGHRGRRGDRLQGQTRRILVPGGQLAQRRDPAPAPHVHRRSLGRLSGRIGARSACPPLAEQRPEASASSQASLPAAKASQVAGSASTTFGGVPRRCVVPGRHWTAPKGGNRTSTEWPGWRTLSSCNVQRTAVASVSA